MKKEFDDRIGEKVAELEDLRKNYDDLLADFNGNLGNKDKQMKEVLKQSEEIAKLNEDVEKLVREKDRVKKLSDFQDRRLKKVLDGNDELLKAGRKYRSLKLKNDFEAKTIKQLSYDLDLMKKEYATKEDVIEKLEADLVHLEKSNQKGKVLQETYHKKLLDEQNARLNSRIIDLEDKLDKMKKLESEKNDLEEKLDEMANLRDDMLKENVELKNQLEMADMVSGNLNKEAERYKKISQLQDRRLQKILDDSEKARKKFRTEKATSLKKSFDNENFNKNRHFDEIDALGIEKRALDLQIEKLKIDNNELIKLLKLQEDKNLELQNSKEQHRLENEMLKNSVRDEVEEREQKIQDLEEQLKDFELTKIKNRELQGKCEGMEEKLKLLNQQLEDTGWY